MIKNKPHYGEIVGDAESKPVRLTDKMMRFLDELARNSDSIETLTEQIAMAGHNRNPLLLPRFNIVFSALYNGNSLGALGYASNISGFWTIVDQFGAYIDNTGFVADEYRDVVNINGSGFLTGIIGPITSAANTTVTFRITIDDEVYTTPAFNMSTATRRLYIGNLMAIDSASSSAVEGFTLLGESTAGMRDMLASTTGYRHSIPDPSYTALSGLGVKFTTVLRVEVSASADLISSYPGYTGALYITE
jgi:hypothetical protein